VDRIAARVRELLAGYAPPDFAEVPDPDAALFLCAIDHRTGYRRRYLVEGSGPYEGSALLWALGLREQRRRPEALRAEALRDVAERQVAELFRIGGESVAGPAERARLWRDLAAGLLESYGGEASELIAAGEGRLGGSGGLLARLAEFEAFSDPLQKKSFLVAKIWERRGWLEVLDPGSWEVCADNVLMRLALRAGLVPLGDAEEIRAATRAAWKQVAERAEVRPPLLDDLLWERGREDPDLVGSEAGELSEPPRPPGTTYY
jgi:hypothetical protein